MTRKTAVLALTLALVTTFTVLQAQDDDRPNREGDRPPGERERGPRDGDRPRGPRERDRPEGRDFRPQPPPVMEALDTDKDGTISAEELANATASLKKLDKNNNGTLDPEELRPERGPRDGEGPQRGRPDGDRPPREGDRREADRARPEGDRPEGDRPPREGRAGDGDRPRPEGRGEGRGPGGGGAEGFVDRLMENDTDKDGKLSRDELLKAAERLRGGRGGERGDSDRPRRPE